jgi:Ca-activated chloride channel family protein
MRAIDMIRLAHPWFLVLIPVLVGVLMVRRRRPRPTVVYSSLDALRGLPRTTAQRIKGWLQVLEIAGLALLVIAMARPQSGREDARTTTHGVAIQLVIDRSESMRALDLDENRWDRTRVSRLDVVKEVVRDFVSEDGDLPGRPEDLIGFVSFAGYVKTHCPLTLDHGLLVELLSTIRVPEASRGDDLLMTAMGDALVIGVSRLRDVEAKSKVLVLLSDGRSNIGVATPESAADGAADENIKVYTVGIGTVRGGLDESTLRQVAEKTGGRYFNARTASDLVEVYRTIDGLERTEIEKFKATRWRDLFPVWLWTGLGLLLLHRLLIDTRFRGLP